MNRKELFLRACRMEPVERVPVWIMRQAGRYLPEYRAVRQKHSFLEVAKTPELAAEVSLQPFRAIGVDAVIVFSDILFPAEAMGLPLEIGDAGPVLGRTVRTAADVEALRQFDPELETRFVTDAIRLLVRSLGPEVPILGFGPAPWTLACYMIEGQSQSGFDQAKKLLFSDPRLLDQLLARIAAATAPYLVAQIDAGAAAVQIFDTWAGELTADDYRAHALPPTRKLIEELRSRGAPTILYSKGSAHLLADLAASGATVLSVDWRIGLGEVRKRFPRLALQGNVDPALLLGAEPQIRAAVQDAVRQTGGFGHVLNLGHGILPATPVANARAFAEAGKAAAITLPAAGPKVAQGIRV